MYCTVITPVVEKVDLAICKDLAKNTYGYPS